MNMMMLLEMAGSGFGDRVAFQNGDEKLTYAQLFEAAGAAATAVKASGCEHLAILDVSSLAFPIGIFASAWAGVPFVPLNYRLTDEEIERLASQITPAFLITDDARADELSRLPDLTVTTRDSFLEKSLSGSPPAPEWGMDPEEIAILLFTSGTTGPPKAAVLRHKHIVAYILGSVEFGGAPDDAAALSTVPPYHVAGIAGVASAVYSGRRVVQLPNFEAGEWLALARREKITNAMVVPTMLSRIVEALEGEDEAGLPHLKAMSYGGGKMPLSVIERAVRLFPDTAFTNAYGLTETSSTVTLLTPDDHREALASEDPAVRRRLTSVGRALPTIEIEIRDDDGKTLGPNERGEIYVRGEQVSGEYLGRGSLLEDDGWFPTRDGGALDEEGFLFLEGRVDDIIVRGGENMSPGEIEDVLLTHDAVADCAVVGVPDEQWGEGVAAVVVVKAGKSPEVAELQDWVKSQLRSSRTPQRIEFWDELPYNETGKLLRRKVKAELVGDAS